jgi:hypothetical protein
MALPTGRSTEKKAGATADAPVVVFEDVSLAFDDKVTASTSRCSEAIRR